MATLNNEQIGISAEIAIADVFGVPIADSYRLRGVPAIVDSIKAIVSDVFRGNSIPAPRRHIAERQSPVDFVLIGNTEPTLSVKTNKQSLGKVAPQRIGQASSRTWFSLLAAQLAISDIPDGYSEKVILFKQIILARIAELLTIYWVNMFDCDYLVHFYNIVDKSDSLTGDPRFVVLKHSKSPDWDPAKITFTKSRLEDWNESNTVKYDGVSIGEFQVHNNRDNFKFRFNIAGVIQLVRDGRLTIS